MSGAGTGPRGRARGGISIEGADGAKAVLTSSTASPIQSMQQSMADYGDDEMVEGANVGAEQGLEDLRSFTVSDAERQIVASRREQTLNRKNSLLATAFVAAGVGAGAWVVGTTLVKRQSDLVNEYAEDMAIHVGDERELALCHKEFKKKIGPKLYRESMFKGCMLAIARSRAMTLEGVRSVKYIVKLFKFSPVKLAHHLPPMSRHPTAAVEQAVKLLVVAARNTDRAQSNARSKLYFLGTMIAEGNPKAVKALEPLKRNVEGSFRTDGPAMLKLRMDNMAESAFQSTMEALPDDQVMESGWEELGISDERAAEIATAMVEDDSPSTGIDFYKTGGTPTNDEESDPEAAQILKQLEDEMEEKKTEPQDEKEPEAEGTAMSYECQVCGYKMFVAKGREFKFFGDGFKCPECGAGKNKFTESEMGED
eukprot:jgi/Undpi1/13953/HiC_scaffold_9.g03604.m1